jgi:hypothetical protein
MLPPARVLILAALLVAAREVSAAEVPQKVPGTLALTWIGNTFEGAGPNGEGRWVQNFIDEIEVTPDGTVVTAAAWDEAGRCTGLYKDGHVNRKLLQQYNGKGGHKAWGWGTGGSAVAADGDRLYLLNTEGELLRFAWTPGDLESARYVDQAVAGKAVGLSARGGKVVVVRDTGEVQVRAAATLELEKAFAVPGAQDVAVDGAGTLWVLAGKEIRHHSAAGETLPGTIADVEKPVSVAIDAQKGLLVICDDGAAQQVHVYDISGAPRRVSSFGEKGGLRAGTPGEAKPLKLFALRGAGTDAQGNIYVAMSKGESVIRKFTPAGALVWEVQSHPFTDCYDVAAISDGLEIYGADEIIEMDYGKSLGKEWRLKAITRDAVKYPDDPRVNKRERCATAMIRKVQGRRLLYTIGMHSLGFDVFAFEDPPSQVARFAGEVSMKDGGWAWDVDANGDIWQGEAPGKKIRRYKLKGFDAKGLPQYDTAAFEETPWPPPFDRVQRVRYLAEQDVMFVSGYAPGKPEKAWGLIGSVMARFDGWSKGNRSPKWTIDLPRDDEQLHPKAFDAAGDYVFAAMVKSTGGKPAMVHVFKAADGSRVGAMWPGPEVGGASGWVDIPYGVRAFKRSNGEYLVLVEEDWRAKNLLYRWKP